MAWYEILLVLLGTLIVLMALGLPVVFAFFATNLVGAYVFMGGDEIGGEESEYHRQPERHEHDQRAKQHQQDLVPGHLGALPQPSQEEQQQQQEHGRRQAIQVPLRKHEGLVDEVVR